jgi:MFS family permease
VGLFFSHSFPEQVCIFNGEQVDFLDISAKANFLLRIAGAYFLGKAADKIGFVKVMKIICLLNIFVSLLLTFFDIFSIFEKGICLCILRGLLSFLRASCFVLPTIYILRNYTKVKHYLYSAFAWVSSIAGIMAANLFFNFFSHSSTSWNIVYALSGFFCFMVYSHATAVPELKIQEAVSPISKPAFLLAFLLAGILGVGVSYQYFYIQHYAADVMVLKTSGQQIIYSPFWITLLLTTIPMAQLTKNLKLSTVLNVLLIGILFSVGILYTFSSLNKLILIFHEVAFGIAFGVFLSPVFIITHRLLQGYNSYFYVNWVLSLGTSCFLLITIYLEKLKFIPPPLLGASLLALLILSCLWIGHHFCLFSNYDQEKIKQA